jgi:hypothetical protein
MRNSLKYFFLCYSLKMNSLVLRVLNVTLQHTWRFHKPKRILHYHHAKLQKNLI